MANPRGRPKGSTILNEEKKQHILDQISEGRSLSDIVEDAELGINRRTVYLEFRRDPVFYAHYARAREISIEIKMGETEDIILGKGEYANVDFERAKELLNDRRWHAIRLQRFRYGDKIDVNANVKVVEGTVIDAEALDIDQLYAVREALQIASGAIVEEDEEYDQESGAD